MALSYQKGLRTRYRNLISTELSKADALLEEDVHDEDLDRALRKVHNVSTRLRDFSNRFEQANENLSSLAHQTEAKEELGKLKEEEAEIINFVGRIVECIADLSAVETRLLSRKKLITNLERPASELDERLTKMIELQSKLQIQTQQLLEAQQLQLDQNKQVQITPSSVKLPNLDIQPFNGDILKWKEFWDSFEATVHNNSRISIIEKFTYLRSKLVGEALLTLSGLTLSNENYQVAIDILTNRYSDQQAVINAHYSALIDLRSSSNNVVKLRALYDTIEKHLRSLDAHGQDINQNVFVSMITSKIPKDVLIQMEIQKGPDQNWTVKLLRLSLNNYIKAREAVDRQLFSTPPQPRDERTVSFGQSVSSSVEALVASNTYKQLPIRGCIFCGETHWSDECTRYPSLSARKQVIKGRCFICLRPGHRLSECEVDRPCFYCHKTKNHHRSLCPQKFPAGRYESVNQNGIVSTYQMSNSAEQILLASDETVVMQTATVQIQNPNSNLQMFTRLLMDSGSHRTYITANLAQKLNLTLDKMKEEISLVTFGSDRPQVIKTSTTVLNIKLRDGTYIQIKANVVPKITGSIHRLPVNLDNCPHWKYLWKNIELADTLPTEVEASNLELLIGNDYYLDLILPEKMEVYPGLYLLGSRLGWILTGRTPVSSDISTETGLLVLKYGQQFVTEQAYLSSPDASLPIKPCLEQFWNLEAIGIQDPGEESGDEKALQTFDENVVFNQGRYFVTWPWKNGNYVLPNNYGLALGRFKSLLQRLRKTPDLVEKVTNQSECGPVQHYIPHHAIITPTKTTTKLRIVYDASAKAARNNNSLNECLYRGPVMLRNLCGLLIRFRTNEIALVADIEKAFLQVGLQNADRDVTRFFWLKDSSCDRIEGNTQIYRFCRVPFGVVSSPFLLAATISFHLRKTNNSVAEKVLRNLYVDNVVSGTQKILGLLWDPESDCISISCPIIDNVASTKRQVLKVIASIFDPLGMFNLITVKAKIFLQELWIKKLDWDDELSNDQHRKWEQISACLKMLTTKRIPRFFKITSCSPDIVYELICFCDASRQAYTASVYLRTIGESLCETSLLFSKTRLAPIKEMSIPRLELLAVVIGVRAINFVHNELDRPISSKVIFTDSQCVLCWLNTNKPLSVFVENRLQEIKSHKDLHFRFVESRENPADLATRSQPVNDIPPKQLKFWLHGPQWLSSPLDQWPSSLPSQISDQAKSDAEREAKVKVMYETSNLLAPESQCPETPFEIDINKFSSLTKLLRVTAWTLRFIYNLRNGSKGNVVLSAQELKTSEILWIRHVQRRHFADVLLAIKENQRNQLKDQLGLYIDDNNLLRCQGRLTNAELPVSSKHPLLLPKSDQYTNLVIASYHKALCHTGTSHTLAQVRQRFWVLKGRATVKKVLQECRVCRRLEGPPYKMPPMPPLPAERVSQCPPFTFTGLDYFGPLYTKDSSKVTKFWVCLFTCLTVRAIRLELVKDMTTEQFILCLRRFIARQGKPKQLISDNAPQFKLAKSTLDKILRPVIQGPNVQNYLSNEGISWHFITQLAPWMGGFYERLVGIVKRALRKSIGKVILSSEQLQTLLYEIEAVVNSRPLVYIDEDINSARPISPSDFLSLSPLSGLPMFENFENSDSEYTPRPSNRDTLVMLWLKSQKLLDRFWTAWRNDYLLNLRERSQTHLKSARHQFSQNPQIGDIVLIKDDLPRSVWKMGRIVSFLPSKDGETRSANVRVSSGKILTRPLKSLYPIECPDTGETLASRNFSEGLKTATKRLPTRKAAEEAKRRIRQHLAVAGVS